MLLGLYPPYTEEFLQEFPCGFRIASASDLWPVMAGRLREEARTVQDRAALGILRREHQPADTRQADRAGAHRARLERGVKCRARQSFIAEIRSARVQYQHLGVGCRIMPLDNTVAVGSDQRTVGRNKHRAHRHLAAFGCRLGFLERECYGFIVIHHGPKELGQD